MNPNGESNIQVRKVDTFKTKRNTHFFGSIPMLFGVSKPIFDIIATYYHAANVTCLLVSNFTTS